jgi:hypothetical protein
MHCRDAYRILEPTLKFYNFALIKFYRMRRFNLFFFILFSLALISFQVSEVKLLVFINDDKTEVTGDMFINCLTIKDLNVIFPITPQMKSYDLFKMELHRFGKDSDILAASKNFDPKSKEFQKKYESKSFSKLKVLIEETDFSKSDLEPNTAIFPASSTVNSVFCKSHDLKHCSFYLIIRGYNKTGEKTQFGEDIYDNGTDLSDRSVTFKSWEDRTIRSGK